MFGNFIFILFGSVFIWGLEGDFGVLIVFLGKFFKCIDVFFKMVFIKILF